MDFEERKIKVLVVDDVAGAAEQYARLIRLGTQLNSIGVDDPNKAIEIVKSNPVCVAVLDQRMPGKSGTELFEEIKEIDASIKAIMLTGEADANEVAQAFRLGYDDH